MNLSHIVLVLVWAQAATFVCLGAAKLCEGSVRLGLAQMCLAVVTTLVYL